MSQTNKTPAEQRNMFGANLRILARDYPSISELARRLRINRTQFNRYLAGESFPRPDVLARICAFFDVDARVLLEPVDQIGSTADPMSSRFLRDFVGRASQDLPEDVFPSGFYSFSRRSFIDESKFLRGLVLIHREGPNTFLRGFEAKAAMLAQGLPNEKRAREFRGLVLRTEDGIAAVVSRLGGATASFNTLSRVGSFDNNFWVGFVVRTQRESPASTRIARLVYEHLGDDCARVMAVARTTGFCELSDLLPFHQRLLRPDEPLT
ncbi:helix-turn-helix domain-containing protein [Sulfitobacter sabulilitoris]|uniref:Helix-turn-helix transcriptional regulator n=1 Tax=Sulfitobacter sabulilitoris TaxID=2562655 RepID=A0A5S3PJ98_9RHOB|nr:helix-turn-helix transcriptional regulator [Sulfitobacter sabulilitoris]TMM54417.1 helix-turn-helix transcriptional regulator [Sulfitobacter sabulilitoris]